MLPCCPLTHGGGGGGGGYRGPPPPLILAPLIYQLVRRSCDPKMVAYVRDLVAHQGPHAVAVNAHKIVQYALSKVSADVLYWFAAKVLNLAPDAAMQTTAFLKSRTDIECDDPPPPPPLQLAGNSTRPAPAELVVGGTVSSSSMAEIERRLERLEIDYQALQEKHYESMKLWTRTPENIHLPVCYYCTMTHRHVVKRITTNMGGQLRENSPCQTPPSCDQKRQHGSRKSPSSWSRWTRSSHSSLTPAPVKWTVKRCCKTSDYVRRELSCPPPPGALGHLYSHADQLTCVCTCRLGKGVYRMGRRYHQAESRHSRRGQNLGRPAPRWGRYRPRRPPC